MDAQYFQLDNWDELAAKYSDDEIWKFMKNFWISRQVLDEKYIYHIIPQNI